MLPLNRKDQMPENGGFYHLAYAMAGGIYSVYALAIYWRWRRVRQRRKRVTPGAAAA